MEGEWEQRELRKRRSLSISVKASGSLEGCCCCPFSREKSRVAAYDNVICKCDPQVLCWYTTDYWLLQCRQRFQLAASRIRLIHRILHTFFSPASPPLHSPEHPTTWTQKNEGYHLHHLFFHPQLLHIYSIDRVRIPIDLSRLLY